MTEPTFTQIELASDSALAEARAIPPGGPLVVKEAEAFVLAPGDDLAYATAGDARSRLKTIEQTIISKFRDPKHKLDEAKASLLSLEREALAPIRTAIGIYEGKIGAEKRRRDVEAETNRLAQLEEARKLEEARRLAQAEAAVDAGLSEEEALAPLDEPLQPVLPPPAPVAPKLPGTSFREYWAAQVTDIRALVAFAAKNPGLIPSLLLPNGPSLNMMAKAQKDALAIPGVRPVKTDKMAGGAR